MPSKSRKQHHFMLAVEHSPQFAAKVGVPQKVGKEFADADEKAHKFVITNSRPKKKMIKGRKPKK